MKKDQLYELIKNNNCKITCKEATSMGYARIYLTMLENEGKIHKIGRGVYAIKDTKLNPYIEFQRNNKKIIYSCFTALNMLKFYPSKQNKVQISVPQGYNASRYKNCDVFYNNQNNYNVGVTKVKLAEDYVLVYNLERSICDIIKDQNRFDSREYNKLMNFYFNRNDINYQLLLEYSKLLKVSKKVQNYLSLFKA